MSRITLAFRCFFRLIFKGSLPRDAAAFLPAEAKKPQLSDGGTATAADAAATAAAKSSAAAAAAVTAPAAKPAVAVAAKDDERRPDGDARRKADIAAQHRDGALALLALLQREGRIIDFLRESLDGFADADIGAAARDVHRGCRKVLEEHLRLEAMMPGAEEDAVTVPKGFDPGEIRLIGEVKGEPPFRGVMRHHGWRAVELKLPTLGEGVDRHVLAPAEIEIA